MHNPRVVLVCWDAAALPRRVALLNAAGARVDAYSDDDAGEAFARLLPRYPPDAVVIDLDELPADGVRVGSWLRGHEPLGEVPLVFAGGTDDDRAAASTEVTDAIGCGWDELSDRLCELFPGPACAEPLPPLWRQLGMSGGGKLAILDAPDGAREWLGELPQGVFVGWEARGHADTVLLFARLKLDLDRRLTAARTTLRDNRSILWIARPLTGSGVDSDLTGKDISRLALRLDMIADELQLIGDQWIAQRFSRRTRT